MRHRPPSRRLVITCVLALVTGLGLSFIFLSRAPIHSKLLTLRSVDDYKREISIRALWDGRIANRSAPDELYVRLQNDRIVYVRTDNLDCFDSAHFTEAARLGPLSAQLLVARSGDAPADMDGTAHLDAMEEVAACLRRIARDGVTGTYVTPLYPDSQDLDLYDQTSEFRHWRTGGAGDAMSANAALIPGVLFILVAAVAVLVLLVIGVVTMVRRCGGQHNEMERCKDEPKGEGLATDADIQT